MDKTWSLIRYNLNQIILDKYIEQTVFNTDLMAENKKLSLVYFFLSYHFFNAFKF